MTAKHEKLIKLVSDQAAKEPLWAIAESELEEDLQDALRALHDAVDFLEVD